MLNIVLLEPEIPSNTGNIGRTCAAAGAALHLIEPLGFILSERNLRRAGMDYWHELEVHRYSSFEDYLEKNPDAVLHFATTKAKKTYAEEAYGPDDHILFGRESAGIPEEILLRYPDRCVRIPMAAGARSLNLANSVAVILYEALRQNRFAGLACEGELHRHTWEEAVHEPAR